MIVLLLAFVFMRTSPGVFFSRKTGRAIRERRPLELRDSQTWTESKKDAARWVAGSTAYLVLGIGLTSLFPWAAPVIAALFVALPVVVMSWVNAHAGPLKARTWVPLGPQSGGVVAMIDEPELAVEPFGVFRIRKSKFRW